jgi:hypothetical protein
MLLCKSLGLLRISSGAVITMATVSFCAWVRDERGVHLRGSANSYVPFASTSVELQGALQGVSLAVTHHVCGRKGALRNSKRATASPA